MSRDRTDDAIFKALGDARRRRMLDLTKDRGRTTGDLCRHFKDLDRCTVMQHLDVLERAGLIIVRRSGRHRWNYLNPLPIQQLADRIRRYAVSTVSRLARLKRELEGDAAADPDGEAGGDPPAAVE
jgi:DNA-binding transcriptional ArsR family regulator